MFVVLTRQMYNIRITDVKPQYDTMYVFLIIHKYTYEMRSIQRIKYLKVPPRTFL